MLVNYTKDAFSSLIKLVNFIEEKNTEGAGLRWFRRYEMFVQKKLINPQKIKKCQNLTFNQLNLRCLNFNDWVIAFTVQDDFILIESLLHKSRITD